MEELRHRVAERFAAQPDRILILSTDSGLCRIIKSELEHHASCPIQTSNPDRLSTDPALAAGALVVCLLGAASVLRPVLPQRCPLVSLAISDVDQPSRTFGRCANLHLSHSYRLVSSSYNARAVCWRHFSEVNTLSKNICWKTRIVFNCRPSTSRSVTPSHSTKSRLAKYSGISSYPKKVWRKSALGLRTLRSFARF